MVIDCSSGQRKPQYVNDVKQIVLFTKVMKAFPIEGVRVDRNKWMLPCIYSWIRGKKYSVKADQFEKRLREWVGVISSNKIKPIAFSTNKSRLLLQSEIQQMNWTARQMLLSYK